MMTNFYLTVDRQEGKAGYGADNFALSLNSRLGSVVAYHEALSRKTSFMIGLHGKASTRVQIPARAFLHS